MNETQLRTYLKSRFRGYQDTIPAEADLTGVVDSLGVFELAEFIEETAGLRIPMADFQPARLSSIRQILLFVDELKARA
jgi:acyl carrier protein